MQQPRLGGDSFEAISIPASQHLDSHALGDRFNPVLECLGIFRRQRINSEGQPTDRLDREAQRQPLPLAFDTGQIASSCRRFYTCKHLISLEARDALGCFLHRILHPTLAQRDPKPI